MEQQPPLLSIHCTAYNQEKYIRQTLDGFVMQQTTFPFEAIVHDDASTDSTAAIIMEYAEKYPHIIKPIFEKENLYSKGDQSLSRVMAEHMRGKYVAFCEGDDYWTDPMKLQKQVDFLESNPDYTLCFHNIMVYDESSQSLKEHHSDFPILEISSIQDLCFYGNYIPTPSAVLRNHPDIFEKTLNLGYLTATDYPIWLFAAEHGKIKRLYDTMAVYRMGCGVWSSLSDGRKNTFQVLNKLISYYCPIEPQYTRCLIRQYALISRHCGEELSVLKTYYAMKNNRFLKNLWKVIRPIKRMFIK